MDKQLLDAYCRSDYRVRLARGGAALIRIGEPLPPALYALTGGREWGFLTAWNPGSQPQSAIDNRAAERRLLADVRALPGVAIHPAYGVGTDGWREPSFWLPGIQRAQLDELGQRYRQRAWLYGMGAGSAQLCLSS
jgi:hypothetical protein